jgi:predicted Zn-dependent peptidase
MYLPQESTDGQASTLGSDLLLTGDWRFQPKLNVQLQAVTAEQVQAYAKKYIAKMQVVLLGDPDKLDPAIATSL